jgi:hypothetical protein
MPETVEVEIRDVKKYERLAAAAKADKTCGMNRAAIVQKYGLGGSQFDKAMRSRAALPYDRNRVRRGDVIAQRQLQIHSRRNAELANQHV